jgi:hypothetical protein
MAVLENDDITFNKTIICINCAGSGGRLKEEKQGVINVRYMAESESWFKSLCI